MLKYESFYRKYGLRRKADLVEPGLHSINNFELPLESVLHYVGGGPTDIGPSEQDPLLQGVDKTIMVDHVTELREQQGPPRKTPEQPGSMIKSFHRKQRQMRPLRRMETALRDRRMVIIVNYALLPHLYRYINNAYIDYNRWYNQTATLWDKVNEMAVKTNRQQFIPMELPKLMPAYTQLKKGEEKEKLNTAVLDMFPEPEALNILDMWKWLGDNRQGSLMSRLEPKALHKVNLVWMESGRFFILNLGKLEEWRGEGETDSEENDITGSISPDKLQRRFLKMALVLFEARTAGASDAAVKEFTSGEEVEGDGETDKAALPGKAKTSHDKDTEDEILTHAEETKEKDVSDEEIEKELEGIDEAVEELNRRSAAQAEATGYEPKNLSPEDPVIEEAEQMVEAGLLSAAEFRRIQKLSRRYQDIQNPFGEGTLAEAATITAEDTQLPEDNPLVDDIAGVTDKSMLNNTTVKLDEKYLKELYHKDIAAAVLSVQKAGLAVQDYKVKKVEEYLNDYEIHTIKVVPPVGAPSTVNFRVPIVRDDGTFKANGVKYRMRKQRGDMPIRKVSPFEVALTSYYGKLFVTRSERAVHNYEKWLTNLISSKGLDSEDESVTEVRFSDVFDHEFRAPRVYSMLAKTFSSFIAGKYFFYFNHRNRFERFGQTEVENAEFLTDGDNQHMLVVGTKGKGTFLLMDPDSNIYSYTQGGEPEPEGTIEELVGIDPSKRPVEILEVGVFGKPVPLGLVLAYEMGLSNLLKHLNLTPRRVGRGKRLNLQEDEFVVRFEDESLIFTRGDKMAEYILGSFNRYHRDIKRHSVYDFDKKDVYQVVLERQNLGARYVRELGLMYKMFIDPITEGILQEIEEPTDLVGLFLRAAELLTTDDHPSPADMRTMRDKGYERISGIVYGELAQAMRTFKSRPAAATTSFDMNPQAVWQTILQDPTGTPVEESNPISNLMQKESVTFSGVGGRIKRSMTAKHRVFHESHLGVTSEATVDSGDVATNVYLTADPKYTSVRGVSKAYDKETDGPARLVSPSMLLAPAADKDDRIGI